LNVVCVACPKGVKPLATMTGHRPSCDGRHAALGLCHQRGRRIGPASLIQGM
jgi:hypothetical protein